MLLQLHRLVYTQVEYWLQVPLIEQIRISKWIIARHRQDSAFVTTPSTSNNHNTNLHISNKQWINFEF